MEIDIALCDAGQWPSDLSERDLVERARHDRAAFAQLYRIHRAAMARYIHRRVGDVHATEDLVAEVFLAALRHLPAYRQRGLPIRAWLYRIATHQVTRWVRRQRRQHRADAAGLRGAVAPEVEPSGGAAEVARQALMAVPTRYQAVLSLHYLEGLGVEEVARALGCRLGTVKSRLSRGREALRRQLEKRRYRP
jgi:RNA polymerase sigma-70 factor (ECF subfamily)